MHAAVSYGEQHGEAAAPPTVTTGSAGSGTLSHSMRVSHLTANIRSQMSKSGRDRVFYDDKVLILELDRKEAVKGHSIVQRKRICMLKELTGGGRPIPVNLECHLRQGQSLQMKALIADSYEQDGDAIHSYGSNTVTLSSSGIVSCQLGAAGIVCNVHFCVSFEAINAGHSPSTFGASDDGHTGAAGALAVFQGFAGRCFWPLYGLFFLFLLLVHLANHSSQAADIGSSSGLELLRLRPGDSFGGGEYMAGCYPSVSGSGHAAACVPAVIAFHGKLPL